MFSDSVDAPSGLRVKSLYRPGSKHLTRETASEFDTLVYDIQDVGCRYYTFISTLKNLLFDCAEYGKRLHDRSCLRNCAKPLSAKHVHNHTTKLRLVIDHQNAFVSQAVLYHNALLFTMHYCTRGVREKSALLES